MSYGFIDTGVVDLGANIDAAYLEGWRNRAGLDFPAVLAAINARAGAYNATLDPWLATLLAPPTTQTETDGSGVQPFDVQPGNEYGPPRPQSSDLVQYPLPIRKWDAATGWTEDGLQDMSLARLNMDLDNLVAGFARRRRKEVLRRLLTKAEVTVGKNTTSVSPGFAGSGTGLNVFSNNYPDGTATAGSYSLYYRIASGSLSTGLLTAVQELRLWNRGATFDLVGGQTVIDLVAAINPGTASTGFVAANPNLVVAGTGTAVAQVDPTEFIGVLYGDVRVHRAMPDMPANYIAIYASFGPLSPMNPLILRYDPIRGRGLKIKSRNLVPLAEAWGEEWYGVGVNKRTGAALIYVAGSGNYTDPTIT